VMQQLAALRVHERMKRELRNALSLGRVNQPDGDLVLISLKTGPI